MYTFVKNKYCWGRTGGGVVYVVGVLKSRSTT